MRRLRNAALIALALVVALVACAPAREPQVTEIVVPAGTEIRLITGRTVDIMPAEIQLRVGDTLRIRNEDASFHEVGPYRVAPQETVEITYGQAGRYEGMCALSGAGSYVIEVTP